MTIPSSAVAQLVGNAPGTAAHFLKPVSLEKLLFLGRPALQALIRHYGAQLRELTNAVLYDEPPCSYIISLKALLPQSEAKPVLPLDRTIDHFVVNNLEHTGIPRLDYNIMFCHEGVWRRAGFVGMDKKRGHIILHFEGDEEGKIYKPPYRSAHICLATEYEHLVNDLSFAALWVHASTEPSNEHKQDALNALMTAANARERAPQE